MNSSAALYALDTIVAFCAAEKETRDFLANKSSKKRDQLIDQLLQRTEFVDYWTHKWSDLLLVSTKKLKPGAMWSYYNWIRENVAANTHWDDFARKIVTATGSTFQNGAGNFYILHDDPKSLPSGDHVASVSWYVRRLRQVPQPPDGEVDE